MAASPKSPPQSGDNVFPASTSDDAGAVTQRNRLTAPLAWSGGAALDEIRDPRQRAQLHPWRVIAWAIIAIGALTVGLWIWIILRSAAERLDDQHGARRTAMAVIALAAQQPESDQVSRAQLVDSAAWLPLAERGRRHGIAPPHYRILGGRIEAQRALVIGNPELWDGAGAHIAFGDGHAEWIAGPGPLRLWQAAMAAPATTAWTTARIAALLRETDAAQR